MRLSFLVAKALLEGNFASYFAKVPSTVECEQPIVLKEGPFTRDSRQQDEERGTVTVFVMVVREVEADAERDACLCERRLRTFGWESAAENGSWRICGLDTTAPAFKERDGSGRFVWQFNVILTVVRSI